MVKPAVDKIPLAARKALKDTWEVKKPVYDGKLSAVLEDKWEFSFNPALVYANCQREDLLNRLGEAIGWYVDAFLNNVEYWKKNKGGAEGPAYLSKLAPKKIVNIQPQEENTKFGYGGITFNDGQLLIVFAEGKFGSNVQQITGPDVIDAAVNEAVAKLEGGSTALTPVAKSDIAKHYEAKIEGVRSTIAKLVGVAAIQLEPNFEANAAALRAGGKEQRLASIGQATFDYFSALQRALDQQKFGGDEMLQEGFADAVDKGRIELHVVEALKAKKYNEVVIDGGVLRIDTTAATWWSNVSETGQGLINLL